MATVHEQPLQAFATVPGRIQYDDSRHIEVKASAAGILREARVYPGTEVREGDVLAIVSSPEVGTARADVLKREADVKLAEQKFEWKSSTYNGLRKLIAAVEEGVHPQLLFNGMGDLKLGAYKEQIVSAYTRYRLAQSLAVAADSTSDSGALSGRTIQERISERDAAKAALSSIIENSLFLSLQDSDSAKLELEDSKRRLKISQQQLRTLLGSETDEPISINENQLSHVEIRAPFAGTIEARSFSRSERVNQGDTLFVMANTSQLWVAADIREREWGALGLKAGETLQITSPAIPDETLNCRIVYVGREVDPLSNAVPLVAEIQNPEGRLRPGQFVWVQLPVGAPQQGLAVPESAIVEHEGQPFVFIQTGQNQFQRVDVTTGVRQGNLIQIRSGLKPEMQVVNKGAFALKSELLLEKEE